MAGSVIPSYRWLRNILSLEKLPQLLETYLSKSKNLLRKLQLLGDKFDSLMLRVLNNLCRHALGREMSEAEEAKFVFFLHKVALVCLIIGYLIGYLVGK